MEDFRGEPLNGTELAAFVLAVETGSMSAAAEALELTQSAVSKRVHSLERRLQTPLLERGRFGVRATEAGRLLYPEAKHALAVLRHAGSVVTSHAGHAPALRLAASHTIGGYLLPDWIARFRLSGPDLQRAQVEIANSQTVLALVRDGGVEIGFIESMHSVEGLETLLMRRDEIAAVVAASHPWAKRRSVPARALRGDAYVARELGSGTRSVAAAALAEVGVELQPTFETASTQGLKRAVLDGGFTLISRLTVEGEEQAGTLRAVSVSEVDLTRPLRAVRRRRASRPPAAQRFWRFLGELRDRSMTAPGT
ncbi:MAG: LysR family transcriptional regulator [Solirubrobacteraceae bacterium]